jgi:hypothetical protein
VTQIPRSIEDPPITTIAAPAPAALPPSFPRRCEATFPNHYAWLLLFSSLDIMLTHTILGRFGAFGGRELNSIADWVIINFGLWGAIGLKLASVAVAIGIIEYIAPRRPALGKRLATLVVAISILPVAWELLLLAWFAATHQPETFAA